VSEACIVEATSSGIALIRELRDELSIAEIKPRGTRIVCTNLSLIGEFAQRELGKLSLKGIRRGASVGSDTRPLFTVLRLS
jgi:hypothetical protein